MADFRLPRPVYGVGDEPDPRFSLANERTFLAWIRTSLALLAVGVGIEALALPVHSVLRFVVAVIFVLLAVVSVVHSWLSWARTERAIRSGRALAGPSSGLIIVIGIVLAATVVVVGLFV